MKYAIGIDIGGTNTKLALVDENANVHKSFKFPTNSHLNFNTFIKTLKDHIDNLLNAGYSVSGIGVGCPNIDVTNGQIQNAPNLKWGDVFLGDALFEISPIPITLSNDANIAAFGEKFWGVAKQSENFIVVTLGTGVGTGIYTHNHILLGHKGIGAEGGHISVSTKRQCGCGGVGHLECFASVRGIKETVKELTGKDLKFRQIAQLFLEDDKDIEKAFDITARYLGLGLSQMCSILSPDLIVLAGGVSTVGEKFLTKVRSHFSDYIYAPMKKNIKIEVSSIATEYGAVLGAASLVFHSE